MIHKYIRIMPIFQAFEHVPPFQVTKYVGSNVFLDCSGTGTALASVKSFYYSNAGAESMCAFDIAVYASPKVTTYVHFV